MNAICFSAPILARVLSKVLLAASVMLVGGCGGSSADVVFDIQFDRFLADGRPVIAIKPNGKPRPNGAGPYGDYYLVLRSSSDQPYTRQFDKDQAEKGVKLDFAVSKKNFQPSDRITVAVENPVGGSFDNGTRLSNVVEVKFP